MGLPIKIRDIKKFSQGKRSIVYTGSYRNKKVAIKVQKQGIQAKDRIKNEVKFLKILNKYKIGPKLISSKDNVMIYHFVEGTQFIGWVKNKKNTKKVIKDILNQCRTLDKLKINKLEFTRPIKHIFIKNNKATIIDFERCYKTKEPKNVTQFFNFLVNKKIIKVNKAKTRKALKKYKHNQTEKNYKELIRLV